jgi:hypothetical protein
MIFTAIYSFAVRSGEDLLFAWIGSLIASIITFSVVILTSFPLIFLIWIGNRYYPYSILINNWWDVINVIIFLASGLFLFELTIKKSLLRLFRLFQIPLSLLLIIRAGLTYFLFQLGLAWLLPYSDWNNLLVFILSGVNTLIDSLLDKLTGSEDTLEKSASKN